MKVKEKENSWLVAVKIRGVRTQDFSSPVARRAKFTAAREVGVLADYVPDKLTEFVGVDIDSLMKGRFFGEVVNMKTLDDDPVQQTVLYGIKIDKR